MSVKSEIDEFFAKQGKRAEDFVLSDLKDDEYVAPHMKNGTTAPSFEDKTPRPVAIYGRLVMLGALAVLAAACGGTHLSSQVAQENAMQLEDCKEALALMQFDAGAERAQAMAKARSDVRICVCSARFTLSQAGISQPDAGVDAAGGCPQ